VTEYLERNIAFGVAGLVVLFAGAAAGGVAFDADDAWPAPQPIVVESAQTAVVFGTPPDEQLTTTPVTPSLPVRVRVLGPAHVEAFGEVVTSGLRQSAYELLAWYVLRPEGATIEAAAAALWPDATTKRGREHFSTALGNLRSRLG
jgi:hypothetical protein